MMWAGFFMIATVSSFAVCVASVAMQPEFCPGVRAGGFITRWGGKAKRAHVPLALATRFRFGWAWRCAP